MTSAILILAVVYVSYLLILKCYHTYLKYKWGCGTPLQHDSKYFYYGFGFGRLAKLARSMKNGYASDNTLATYTKYNVDTYETMTFGKLVIDTINIDNIKAVLSTQFNEFGIGYRKDILGVIDEGIFVSEGHKWKLSRERLRPQFAREQISQIRGIEPHFKRCRSLLLSQCKENPEYFDLQTYFFSLSFDVSSEFLFSESVATLNPNSTEISRAYHAQEGFLDALKILQRWTNYRALAGRYAKFLTSPSYAWSLAQLHKFADVYVQKALALTPLELEEKLKDKFIILYELVKVCRDPKILRDEVLSIMFAGRDTTSALLSFMFYELARNPEIFQKLREEILDTFGKDEQDLSNITFESMKKCKYLKFCLNEALRMYPPVMVNFRTANKTTTIPRGGGSNGQDPVLVPKGTNVVFSTYSVHRSKRYYGEDAEVFRPERWETLKPGWAFLPFLSGPRICLGQQFALTEASYVTIRFLQSFKGMSTNMTTYPPKKLSAPASRLIDGLYVKLVPDV